MRVAVIGATGLAGQQFLAALAGHPYFEVAALAASERSAGKRYREAITDAAGALRWYCAEPLDPAFAALIVQDAGRLDAESVDLVFTAVESDAARELEPRYAKTTPVVSTASAFRDEPDVPIFIPGVNMDHDALIAAQRRNRGWKGFVTPVPNCTTTGLAMTLKPLHDAFEITGVVMTSLQGLSGAGRSPGVRSRRRRRRSWAWCGGDTVEPAAFPVSATCTRVAVLEAHTESVSVALRRTATMDDVKAALREHGREFTRLGLPSCPPRLIDVSEDPFRPQPRLDRDREQGMLTSVGRVRPDHALLNGVKYVLVSHNTTMGAARGALLVAEYLAERGHV